MCLFPVAGRTRRCAAKATTLGIRGGWMMDDENLNRAKNYIEKVKTKGGDERRQQIYIYQNNMHVCILYISFFVDNRMLNVLYTKAVGY